MQDTRSVGPIHAAAQLTAGLFVALVLLAAPTSTRALEIPVEVATGPAFIHLDRPRFGSPSNRLAAAQPWQFGWRIDVAAVIDRKWAREHPSYVPPRQRARLERAEEVRYAPPSLSLLPRSVVISPKFGSIGAYGATWELLSFGAGTGFDWLRFRAGASAILTYTLVHGDVLNEPFHFLRPGVDLEVSIHVPFGDLVGLTVGWTSNIYVPQVIGGGLFEFVGNRESLWHTGEGFVLFHYRFPYEVGL